MKTIPKALKSQIYFIIPAWNEEESIGEVMKNLYSQGFFKLIIIADGSDDNTPQVVKDTLRKGSVLLEHVINRGQGAALRTGMEYALKHKDCKYIVHFDSDGQMRISDLPKFISPLERGKCDVVLGSRFILSETKKLVPLKKRILLKGALLITKYFSNIKLTDTHNGYRVMNRKAAKLIDITLDDFTHASEILDEIAKKRITYKEVPVYIDYTDYSTTKLTRQKISNSLRILVKMLLR